MIVPIRPSLVRLASIILFSVSILSCNRELSKENSGNLPVMPSIPYTPQTVNASIEGRVLDENKKPVSGAQVKIDVQTATTDQNGVFRISDASVEKYAAFVKVSKDGYFLGSRTLIVNEKAVNYVEIELLPKQKTGSFSAAAGGVVSLSNGGDVFFPAGAIITKSTATSYTGTVNVRTTYIDPTASNFQNIMPGDLRGITTGNEERGLQSFGMMAVELVSDANEPLQIAAGKTAVLTFPIPQSIASFAPATIPLWYFDEMDGLWKEEGSAKKVGNNYVGNVSHFSFWNCDAPFRAVVLDATFKDQADNPLAQARVQIKKISDNTITYGYTDSAGKVSGLVPANEQLQLKVINRCGSDIYSKNIGPFATTASLGDVKITLSAPTSITVAGTAVDCNNQPITNGFAQILVEGRYYSANLNNGQFSININRCSATPDSVAVSIFDIAAVQQASAQTITGVTTGNYNTGTITVCSAPATAFVNVTVDGVSYAFVPPADSISIERFPQPAPGYTRISTIKAPGTGNQLSITFKLLTYSTAGTVSLGELYFKDNTGKSVGVYQTAVNADVTSYGPIGGFISGSFNAQLEDTLTNKSIPVKCSFQVKRWY